MQDNGDEVWRDVVGYEGFYEVSSLGRVRSVYRIVLRSNGSPMTIRERIVRDRASKGYRVVTLVREGKFSHFTVHKLVMRAFVGARPHGYEVAHWDGCRSNNNLSNLRYATSKENEADKDRHGSRPVGEASHLAKLTAQVVRDIMDATGTQQSIADRYGISQTMVSRIKLRRNWVHL